MTGTASRLACICAYDGAPFQGWQVQPGGTPTVQETIEDAFAKLSGGVVTRIHASGRTDTGVHARGQVFHVDPPREGYSPSKWQESLNGVLPRSIRILQVRHVDEEFHARFDAVEKEYRYFLYGGQVMPPDLRGYRVHIRAELDMERMREAAALFLGTHAFTSFSARRGDGEEDPVRTVSLSEIVEEPPGCFFRVRANGFLYKMVRRLTGALIDVGRGNLAVDDVVEALRHPSKQSTILTAPPQGLFLWEVQYPDLDED